jgi:tetratricopeptide (TPR) repeat protein
LRRNLVNALVARGNAYFAKGENENAVADFKRALALDRDLIASYPGVAEKLTRLGAIPSP